MEDTGRKESEKKLQGKGPAKYLESEKAQLDADYAELFEMDEAQEAETRERRAQMHEAMKENGWPPAQFAGLFDQRLSARRFKEILELYQTDEAFAQEQATTPEMLRLCLDHAKSVIGIMEHGGRLVMSKTRGMLTDDEAKKAIEEEKEDLLFGEMAPIDAAVKPDMVQKLKELKNGVKVMTKVLDGTPP